MNPNYSNKKLKEINPQNIQIKNPSFWNNFAKECNNLIPGMDLPYIVTFVTYINPIQRREVMKLMGLTIPCLDIIVK